MDRANFQYILHMKMNTFLQNRKWRNITCSVNMQNLNRWWNHTELYFGFGGIFTGVLCSELGEEEFDENVQIWLIVHVFKGGGWLHNVVNIHGLLIIYSITSLRAWGAGGGRMGGV